MVRETAGQRVRELIIRFDARAEELLAPLSRSPQLTKLAYVASELADFSLLWHLLGATLGLRDERAAREAFRLSGVLAVESAIVNGGIKQLFRRARPVYEGERPHNLRLPVTSSFPSGHASSAFCAAVLLTTGRPARRIPIYALATLVAMSRVQVRIHHPSDVVAGAAIGTAIGMAGRRLWRLV